MFKNKHKRDTFFKDPFQSPRANPKRAFKQVNGETEKTQQDIILEVQTRKRT